MRSCCSGETRELPKSRPSGETACPRCGEVGRVVADETVRAILKPDHSEGLLAVERRFCKTPACAVLYYGADGRIVEKGAASVRVGVKETDDPVPLCYCFGFTRADVRRQVAERGDSDILARITAEVRAGRCCCEVKNPSGTCCLGDVNKAVKDAKEALSQAGDGKGRSRPAPHGTVAADSSTYSSQRVTTPRNVDGVRPKAASKQRR